MDAAEYKHVVMGLIFLKYISDAHEELYLKLIYTPSSVVRLLVEMLEPYEGRVFDPCCGSGGMFSNQTTWRLAKMNLSIRGIFLVILRVRCFVK